MDRRRFLSLMIGGIAATAAIRTFPFRVFSFSSEIVAAPIQLDPTFEMLNYITLKHLRADILTDNFFIDTPLLKYLKTKMDVQVAG